MKNAEAVWREMLSTLEVDVHSLAFDVWIRPLRAARIQDDILVLCAASQGAQKEVSTRYMPDIKRALRAVDGAPPEVVVIAEEDMPAQPEPPEEEDDGEIQASERNKLDPKFNFHEFVDGANSNHAYAAAIKVAQFPGGDINPLFIYGGVGLGKTHLMQAIGNELRQTLPNFRIMYVSAITFLNDFISSISTRSGQAFRERYRNVDLLMIDDVQFLTKKVQTQEEMFHLFEDLKREGKQMVFTSDRPPKDIPDLDARVRSRFASSIIADIQPPDLETRIAILKKKAENKGVIVGANELCFIAERVTSNVREMEGVLTKVLFLATLYDKKIDMDICREALKDYMAENSDETSIDEIVDCTCRYFGVKKGDVVGKRKNKEVVVPRQVAIYIITEFTNIPLSSIGEYFGGREHTTVIYARDKIDGLMKTDVKIRTAVNDIKAMVLRK